LLIACESEQPAAPLPHAPNRSATASTVANPVEREVIGEPTRGVSGAESDLVAPVPVGSSSPPELDEARPPANGRRLTKSEYLFTVEDWLGIVPASLEALLMNDGGGEGFRNSRAALLPSATRSVAFEAAATFVGTNVDAKTLLAFAPCSDLTDSCAEGFVNALGRALYRRPLQPTETSNLRALFATAEAQGDDFETGARLTLRAMLQSPHFLYRVERVDRLVQSGDKPLLDEFELTSRLSFLIWQSAPDAALLERAERGSLSPLPATIHAMLESPKARRGLWGFVEEWLKLYKLDTAERDRDVYPEFGPSLVRSMKHETRSLFERVVFDERAPFMSAYSRRKSAFEPELSPIYGAPAPPAGEEYFFGVNGLRGGFLTHAGFIAAHSVTDTTSIIDRGLFTLRALLCGSVPAPPTNAATSFGDVDETLPQRARFEQHRTDPACGGCHAAIDPLGYPFEAYDGIGRFQTHDVYGNPISNSGEITFDGQTFTYESLPEFARLLSNSSAAQACVVRQFTQFAFGRELNSEKELLHDLEAAFAANGDFLDLIEAIATSTPYSTYASAD
jgi:hypothetical protein